MTEKSPFWTSARLVLMLAAFITIFANYTMFSKLREWRLSADISTVYVFSIVIVQFFALVFFFSLFTMHRAYRAVLIFLLLITAVSAYFVDSYGVIIDRAMLINAMQTNRAEALGLLSWRMLAYLTVLFILPGFLLYRARVCEQSVWQRLTSHLVQAGISLGIVAALIFSMSSFWQSFLREQKQIRAYSTPLASINAAYQVVKKGYFNTPKALVKIGEDAKIPVTDMDRELVIVVVGETARADHFSLNGYGRKTNPLLSKHDVVSFSNVSSCGTNTAVSVPCMFSFGGRENYSESKAKSQENILDVLSRAGVHVLWRDNNSSSKGVADRLPYEDFLGSRTNPVCDPECRDIGMLNGLDQFIEKKKQGDILIVLHQMGSHGPAYYQRVPDAFQKFQPICQTNQLDQCTPEQIRNSYDNTILYTDYFLDQVISFLKKYDDRFETVMLYIGDHGESLGEGGIYLHGMPYMLAPKTQINVPEIVWFGKQHTDLDIQRLQTQRDMPLSHDNLFHTLLGIFEVQSAVYVQDMDVQHKAMKN